MMKGMTWKEIGEKYLLLAILVVAFLLRGVIVFMIPLDFRVQEDATTYLKIGENIHEAQRFALDLTSSTPYAWVPPGYPLFLALFGVDLLLVRIGQLVLGVVSVGLTYLLGKMWFDERVGLLAGGLVALYPPLIIYTVFYLSENLYLFLLLLFWLLFTRSLQTPTTKWVIGAGVTFGLTLLTREALLFWVLLLPFIGWWWGWGWGQIGRYLLLFVVATFLTMAPWLWRNQQQFGTPLYTERISAISYSVFGRGYLSAFYQNLPDESPELLDYYAYYGRTTEMRQPQFLLEQPREYFTFLIRRFNEFWFHANGLESVPERWGLPTMYTIGHIFMVVVAFGTMGWLAWRGNYVALLNLLLFLYLTALVLFFRRPHPRYNLPFLPILFVYLADACWRWGNRVYIKWQAFVSKD